MDRGRRRERRANKKVNRRVTLFHGHVPSGMDLLVFNDDPWALLNDGTKAHRVPDAGRFRGLKLKPTK
jgi:hypothetical protein